MSKIVIIRGCPGSGKSSLANKILNDNVYGYNNNYTYVNRRLIVSADQYFEFDIQGPKGAQYYFDANKLGQAHGWSQWRVKQCCQNGIEIIIVDNTNTTWKEIRPYVEIAKRYGYEVEVREPNTEWRYDVDECVKRNSHGVPKETIQRMRDRWESTESINSKVEKYLK